MIAENINKQIVKALKEKDEIRLSTLRLLSSELHNAKIDKRDDLTKEEELVVVRREAKKRKDAIEALRQAQGKPTQNRPDLDDRISREESELEILKEFLPKDMSDKDLEKIVADAIKISGAEDITEMGKVIGLVMEKVKARVEGGRVAALVKAKLS